VNDEAVRSFRKAMILFEAGRFSEAEPAFASFMDRYPDHALAGAAQFYIGESFFKQGNYTQAYDEFQRVLMSYDRSAHVTETLRDLAETEDQLHKNQDAARHRQELSSLFPQSPAFASAAAAPAPAPIAAPPAAAPPVGAGSTAIFDDKPQKKISPDEDVAGVPLHSRRKPVPTTPEPDGAKLDEPPPPTAPMDTGAPAKIKPGNKPNSYPATEDKS
jgi:tetratricopeptide (TPR) repeat protein